MGAVLSKRPEPGVGVATGVLAATQAVASEFEAQVAALDADLGGGVEQAASEPIAAALAGLLDVVRPDLEFLPPRTGACLQAAVIATNAYRHGDEEMAAWAQDAAWFAPDPHGVIPAGRLPR